MQKTSDNLFVVLLISICGAFILIISFILLQIRAQNKLLKQKRKLAEAETQYQKDLLHSVIQYQEDDRKRIGQNLHDDVGGQLAVLKILIAENEKTLSEQEETSVVLIDRIIDNVRNIAHSLSPQHIPMLDLWEVMEDLCDSLNKTGKLSIFFTCTEAVRSVNWGKNISLSVFRVLQELISNTIKHAGASRVNLSFDMKDNKLAINYQDNGKGLDAGKTAKGMGINNIVSRLQILNADWEIDSKPGLGYSFGMIIPPEL